MPFVLYHLNSHKVFLNQHVAKTIIVAESLYLYRLLVGQHSERNIKSSEVTISVFATMQLSRCSVKSTVGATANITFLKTQNL